MAKKRKRPATAARKVVDRNITGKERDGEQELILKEHEATPDQPPIPTAGHTVTGPYPTETTAGPGPGPSSISHDEYESVHYPHHPSYDLYPTEREGERSHADILEMEQNWVCPLPNPSHETTSD